ncbi:MULTISPECIES: BREX protein BrxB domain-containing protein [Deefgea]|uniref:DUF1788 domain-containing protein n=1 Tax=Deefgea chitinilytica TaxID=570276 RepID=A0ABS2C8R3_9NEIS|nr:MULTISPECIES: BREX protein BrxB domain-containing protein [Deefgea]MBM5570539.1 DUF1788 domain-containing protein [Deefgea chitinilytica]MBM9887768.1 DUF1788 domain-containing protein [Deefgea sp. CFH1-16]
MSKVARLVSKYQSHIGIPWAAGLAAVQRVIFAVYDKTDELRMRAHIDAFELATHETGHEWLLLDVTNAFPEWMAQQEYRESYFECPDDLAGYHLGELDGFYEALITKLRTEIDAKVSSNMVVAIMGVGSLFGLCRASTIVEGLKDHIPGRLLVFFPGEFIAESYSYRLLDARDGWNYQAVPLTTNE